MIIRDFIGLAFNFYWYLMMARILMSWIPHDRTHPIVQFIYSSTDLIFEPFRRIIPPFGMIDISPIFAFMALRFAQRLIMSLLAGVLF